MEIVKMKLSELNPAEYNPRKALKPGDPAYEKLKASILSFGNVEPIVWNRSTGNVVGGHQRLRVLLDLGVTESEVSVVELSEVDEKAAEHRPQQNLRRVGQGQAGPAHRRPPGSRLRCVPHWF